jgi:catecholate siderophore receptor
MNSDNTGARRPERACASAKQPRSLRQAQLTSAAALAAAALAVPGLAAAQQGPAVEPQGPVAEEPQQQASEVEGLVIFGRRHPDINPLADPVAPYKIDQLTSEKFTEPLINVPKSITVISKEVIADSGALTFRDLMRTQPGVTLGTGEGGNAFGDRFFIRGFDTRNDIYIDGIRDPGVTAREIFAVEQVEILKGPSSTFGGRGTTGGAISIVSKEARMDNDFMILHAFAGTEETGRAVFDWNHQYGDKVALRVNLMGHTGGTGGRNYVYSERWGVAFAGRWEVSDQLTLRADYYHNEADELPDWGTTYNVSKNAPVVFNRNFWYGVLERDFQLNHADIYTVKAEYDYSENLSFSTTFRLGDTLNTYVASAPEAPNLTNANPDLWTLRANPKQRDQRNHYWANQTNATLKFDLGGFENTLVGGFETSTEEIRNKQYASLNAELGGGVVVAPSTITHLISAPNPKAPWPFPRTQSALRQIEVDADSFYFVDTIKLTDQWQVMGGVRHDTYDIALKNTTLATGAVTQVSNKTDFTNWHLGLVFKPISNMTIYAAAGTSSNPSGEQLDASAADYGGLVAQNAALDAEENEAYELGVKWNVFDEHLALSMAGFRVDKDARVQTGAGAGAVISISGVQRVEGFELTAQGNLTPNLSIFGGITFLDSEIIKSPVAAQVGTALPNITETSFSLMARYEFNPMLYAGGLVNYNDEKHGGTVNSLATFVPDYWRGDLFVGYHVTSHIDLSLHVLNVTDEVYFDALYRSAAPFTYIAPGRSAFLKLDYIF